MLVRVDVITKEYPPNVYGVAGVHVVELAKALRQSIEVQVRAFGDVDPEPDTTGYPDLPQLDQANAGCADIEPDHWRTRLSKQGTQIDHQNTP